MPCRRCRVSAPSPSPATDGKPGDRRRADHAGARGRPGRLDPLPGRQRRHRPLRPPGARRPDDPRRGLGGDLPVQRRHAAPALAARAAGCRGRSAVAPARGAQRPGPGAHRARRSDAAAGLLARRAARRHRARCPTDIIAPRLLTPGGLLVLGGAPKVGKSDFVISLLAHMAAGVPFLGFTPPRPLRVFYLQAEIQYHYLRERFQAIRLDPAAVLAAARDNLVATPKLQDAARRERRRARRPRRSRAASPTRRRTSSASIRSATCSTAGPRAAARTTTPPCCSSCRSGSRSLRETVESGRRASILCHHTKKITKKQLAEDPFQALSGASALRGFYTCRHPDAPAGRGPARAEAGLRAAQRPGDRAEAGRQGRRPVGRDRPPRRAAGAQGARREARRRARAQARRHPAAPLRRGAPRAASTPARSSPKRSRTRPASAARTPSASASACSPPRAT